MLYLLGALLLANGLSLLHHIIQSARLYILRLIVLKK